MRAVKRIKLPMKGGMHYLNCEGNFTDPLAGIPSVSPMQTPWPIGSVFITSSDINPALLLVTGTWVLHRTLGNDTWFWERTA